jgi:2-polyprenyl-3-methyl-5-hydroxy-6-metoxy-1,4-benzoquinol methylase
MDLQNLKTIEQIFRQHARGHDERVLNQWLSVSTLSRYRDWVPRPDDADTSLLDIGCYQPSIGYYFALGWRRVIGIAKEEGEVASASAYTQDGHSADIRIVDVEREEIAIEDGSIDAVVMMEILEHFGLDPMHALIEANRVLKDRGRLVLTTPNAASWKNLRRIVDGRSPYIGQEFSGFSSNRHNRLYDHYELTKMLENAGFAVTRCTSISYEGWIGSPLSVRIFRKLTKVADRWRHARSSTLQPEREDYLVMLAEKTGVPKERYPKWLYFDEVIWSSWYRAIKKPGVETILAPHGSERACR